MKTTSAMVDCKSLAGSIGEVDVISCHSSSSTSTAQDPAQEDLQEKLLLCVDQNYHLSAVDKIDDGDGEGSDTCDISTEDKEPEKGLQQHRRSRASETDSTESEEEAEQETAAVEKHFADDRQLNEALQSLLDPDKRAENEVDDEDERLLLPFQSREYFDKQSLRVIFDVFLLLLDSHVKPLAGASDQEIADLALCVRFVRWRVCRAQYVSLLEEMSLNITAWNASLHEKLLQLTDHSSNFRRILSVLEERAEQMDSLLEQYPQGAWHFNDECAICLEQVFCFARSCCGAVVCEDCLTEYLTTRVSEGLIRMDCPIVHCQASVTRAEILSQLSDETRNRYIRFLVDANADPNCKTCPQCCEPTTVSKESLKNASTKRGLSVKCVQCGQLWCFSCHAPQHPTLTCKEFLSGQLLLKKWAKHRRSDNHSPHAQKCPKCAFFIERIDGCDHMTCSKCNTEFCYACGERFQKLKFVGNHSWKYSILGCPQRLLPDKPHTRRLLRGTIFSSLLVGSVPAVAVATPLAVTVAAIGLPMLGIYKVVKRARKAIEFRRRQQIGRALEYRSPYFIKPRRPSSVEGESVLNFRQFLRNGSAVNGAGEDVSGSAFDWEQESVFFGDMFASQIDIDEVEEADEYIADALVNDEVVAEQLQKVELAEAPTELTIQKLKILLTGTEIDPDLEVWKKHPKLHKDIVHKVYGLQYEPQQPSLDLSVPNMQLA